MESSGPGITARLTAAGWSAGGHGPRARSPAADDSPRGVAEQLVSVALVQPVLSGFRGSSMAAPPFAPTGTERAFRGMLDAALARDVVRRGNWPIVDRIARALESRGGEVRA